MAYEDYYEEDCGEFAEDECTYDDDFDGDSDDDPPAPDGDNDDGGYDDEDNY